MGEVTVQKERIKQQSVASEFDELQIYPLT
jgi:hypothetical protein